ncbi:MAG: MoaD/ThiS family protein [Verrucomicrobia bacterium]|nr:MoaD/ThiS family protein [Verrucomicrobiota bacterium]
MGESNLRAITVEYFAILREQRGVARETLTTAAGTPTALYAELHGRHGFSLPADGVRAAVNGVVVNGDAPLRDGDLVVFIPPVAGG